MHATFLAQLKDHGVVAASVALIRLTDVHKLGSSACFPLSSARCSSRTRICWL